MRELHRELVLFILGNTVAKLRLFTTLDSDFKLTVFPHLKHGRSFISLLGPRQSAAR